jgi:hypothetical protein
VPDLEGDSGGTEQNEMHGVLPAGTTSRGYELKSLAKATSVSLRTREVTVNRDVAIKECLPTSLLLQEAHDSADHAEQFA